MQLSVIIQASTLLFVLLSAALNIWGFIKITGNDLKHLTERVGKIEENFTIIREEFQMCRESITKIQVWERARKYFADGKKKTKKKKV